MAKRLSLIFFALLVLISGSFAAGGERYPDRGVTIITANIGTSDTTVTASVNGYWTVKADTDVHFNFGAAATTTHPKLASGSWINLYPIRINKSGSSRTPASMHFIANSATGDIQVIVVGQ